MIDKWNQEKKDMKYVDSLQTPACDDSLSSVDRVMICEMLSKCTIKEREILRYAAMLPQGGMEIELFCMSDAKKMRASLIKLIEDGLLQQKNELLCINPSVRAILIEELKPTTENCGQFLQWFRGQYDQKTYDGVKFAQIASLYENASEVLQEKDGFWISEAGFLWNVLVEPQRALACNHRAVELLEQNAPGSPNLATAYSNLGSAYGALGDHEKALEYKLKDLIICEQVLPPAHPDLAITYNNVGSTYGALGDHEKALEYKIKALEIREQVLPPTHPDLATSYNNVGLTYGDLGCHEKALEYQLKALEIQEQVLPPTHPTFAGSYNNVGSTYGALGDHEKALEYKIKALEIWEQVLPPTHPDLATSYNNVGTTYGALGDHEKELEYQLKALGIQEQSLPPDHPYNVFCRSNIALTYAKMEDFIRANEYMRRALESAERSMKGHPNLEMYRQAAQIMELCARFQKRGMPLPFDNPFQ